MAGDFFRRKGLLPNKGGTPVPPSASREGAKVPSPPLRGPTADVGDDAFSRPTLVPDTPPQEQATRWELNEKAPTAPAPKRGPATTPAAGLDPLRVQVTDDAAERITLSVSDIPQAGAHALLARRAEHPAIHPPPKPAVPSQAPESLEEITALERKAFVSRETVQDMADPTSSSRSDSGQNALGFVDALPRATSIPPDRGAHSGAGAVNPEDRVSIASLSELYALSDFSGALEMAERRLETNPNDAEAQRYVQDCRRVLIKMQLSRLGSLQQIVELAVDASELQWLTIDHRAGFLLSLIDGLSTLEDLLDICGMPRLQALQIFADLAEQKVVRLRPMVTF